MMRKPKEHHKTPEGSTFKHFRRLLGYVRPHKRYLVPAMACVLLMAITYSASIGSILPVLTVMVKPQGLHGWVDQYIAEKRLRCELGIYDVLRHRQVEGVPPAVALIRSVSAGSPLLGKKTDAQAGLCEGDFILRVNDVAGDAVTTFHALAGPETTLVIEYQPALGGPPATLRVQASPLDTHHRAMRAAVDLIPRGRTAEERWYTLAFVLGLLLCVVVIGNVARLFAEYLTVLVNCRSIIDLRRQMYAHVLNMPLSRFSRNTTSTMSMFSQDMQEIFRGLNNFFQKVVAEPFKAIGAISLAFALNWRLTLVMLLGAPLAAILFRKMGRKIRRASRKLLIGYGVMLGQLESTLTGLRIVKGYTREDYERKRLFKIDRHLLQQELRMGFIEALTSPAVEVIGFAAAVGAILFFARNMLQQPDQTPEFITMLVCLGAIFDPIRKLSTVYPKLQRANAAAQRIFDLIDSPSEYAQDVGRPDIQPIRQQLTFENVTFTYPDANQPAVRDFSLDVAKGEVIALVGPNGSGKTTVLSLLPRFFPVDSGRILIDGQDTSQVTLRSLRRQFSIITQESVIFPDTVRANIAYGRPNASEEAIRSAAERAFADEFIQQMPEGYDTIVGEHGATLSGGQRQRIAIARAILRDAPILIFDEATGQVDPESELKILQALDEYLLNRTSFIIAHRFSTIRGAHRIVVMEDGRALAIGTHECLYADCPLYRRLYETQFRDEG